MARDPRELPDQATRCLACACANCENRAAAELLVHAGAHTATGVIAAIFLAPCETRWQLTDEARRAITEQRDWCNLHGPIDPENCTVERLLNRA